MTKIFLHFENINEILEVKKDITKIVIVILIHTPIVGEYNWA